MLRISSQILFLSATYINVGLAIVSNIIIATEGGVWIAEWISRYQNEAIGGLECLIQWAINDDEISKHFIHSHQK